MKVGPAGSGATTELVKIDSLWGCGAGSKYLSYSF